MKTSVKQAAPGPASTMVCELSQSFAGFLNAFR